MRMKKFAILTSVFVLLLIVGCKNNPTANDIALDEEAIQDYILGNQEGYFAYDVYYGQEDTVSVPSAPGVQLSAITALKLFWYRELQNANRQISVDVANDSAFVTISLRINGLFHIIARDTAAIPDSTIDYQKNLRDNFVSYAIFKRYPGVAAYRGWRLEGLTGAEVISDSVKVQIDSIRINCESYTDTVLVTPWVFFRRGELLTLDPQEDVTITLYTADDVYSFLHAHSHSPELWLRSRFTEIEPGVWQREWQTSPVPGIKTVAFDILQKLTIDEENYIYDSNVWMFPYRIE